MEIDRKADIPRDVIDGLGRVGVLGMTAPKEYGGQRIFADSKLQGPGGNRSPLRLDLGFRECAPLDRNSRLASLWHPRAKGEMAPEIVTGEQLGAFALTEAEAGSDAANVQMQARTERGWLALRSERREALHHQRGNRPGADRDGAHAGARARTRPAITAFLVTPDMPGFEMLEARMPKMGIRGTATGRFALRNVKVPKENVLGPLGKGLQGRADRSRFRTHHVRRMLHRRSQDLSRVRPIEHANTRKQFNKTLGNFHLVKKKIARIAADAYAMEAMTTMTAALIDRGLEDYMLETAMLKVFTTERLWECINDVFQIYGGSAYFVDLPLERMMRDARINQIGEGANEVLTSFIALVGMRGPGMEFKEIYDTMVKPTRERGFAKAWTAGKHRLGATVRVPEIPGTKRRAAIVCQSTWAPDLAF